jgi:hypothetical protein
LKKSSRTGKKKHTHTHNKNKSKEFFFRKPADNNNFPSSLETTQKKREKKREKKTTKKKTKSLRETRSFSSSSLSDAAATETKDILPLGTHSLLVIKWGIKNQDDNDNDDDL